MMDKKNKDGSRDYFIWVVPPGGGRVRRLSIPRRVVLISALVGVLFFGGVLHLAVDYVRLQYGRIYSYVTNLKENQKVGSLVQENEELQQKLVASLGATDKLKGYNDQIQEKLVALNGALDQIARLGVLPKDRLQKVKAAQGVVSKESVIKQAERGSDTPSGIGGPEGDDGKVAHEEVDGVETPLDTIMNFFEWQEVPDDVKPSAALNSLLGIGGPEPEDSLNLIFPADSENLGEISPEALSEYFADNKLHLERLEGTVEVIEQTTELLQRLPVVAPAKGILRSGYGYRVSPFSGRVHLHKGIDVSAKWGSPVRTSGEGVVTAVGWRAGYGLTVDVEHFPSVVTRYAHMSAVQVRKGQRLQQGALVGRVGNTGRSTGPHLHYEILVRGKSIDPAKMMKLAEELQLAAQGVQQVAADLAGELQSVG